MRLNTGNPPDHPKHNTSLSSNTPWSFFSVSQNFCSSVKYLSKMNTLERPSVAIIQRLKPHPAMFQTSHHSTGNNHSRRLRCTGSDDGRYLRPAHVTLPAHLCYTCSSFRDTTGPRSRFLAALRPSSAGGAARAFVILLFRFGDN
ncbi:hypothetical protein Zmor_007998 [Zophobas morio]|uniref:Uncharacterized protein n=1 Tax=Zophobas morio TaxID=2755281 RepID=A0AA38MPB7_9CUCU|nr:hypothetical protein Zmor_007998 [Zophobas morio]